MPSMIALIDTVIVIIINLHIYLSNYSRNRGGGGGGGGRTKFYSSGKAILLFYTVTCENPGGGHSQYILVGVCHSTSKKGGLRHGNNPKKGVLSTGTTKKRGGGLKYWSCKKDNLSK